MENSIRVARVSGIDIGVHYTWIFIFLLVTWSLATGFFPQQLPEVGLATILAISAGSAILLFVSVLVHELSHSFVARSRGNDVKGITLFLFGGVSNIDGEPRSAKSEFLVAIVGPISSVLIGVLCFGLLQVVGGRSSAVAAVLLYLGSVNLILALFNLVPGFPLDGGRVLRAGVWAVTGSLDKATQIASTVGRGIAFLFVLGGLYIAVTGPFISGMWLVFIGWFLSSAAGRAADELRQRRLFRGVHVHDVMEDEPITVPASMPVLQVADDYFVRQGLDSVAVTDGDRRVIGFVTVADLKRRPREDWDAVAVGEVMRQRGELATVDPGDDLEGAVRILAEPGVGLLPVIDNGKIVGILSRRGIQRSLEVRQELDRAA